MSQDLLRTERWLKALEIIGGQSQATQIRETLVESDEPELYFGYGQSDLMDKFMDIHNAADRAAYDISQRIQLGRARGGGIKKSLLRKYLPLTLKKDTQALKAAMILLHEHLDESVTSHGETPTEHHEK